MFPLENKQDKFGMPSKATSHDLRYKDLPSYYSIKNSDDTTLVFES